MTRVDIKDDAQRAFDVLQAGGTAILPMDVGYSLIGGSPRALATIFETKGREQSKLNAMLGDNELHKELHKLDGRGLEIVDAITNDYGLPLGAIAQADMEHPILRNLPEEEMRKSSKTGTVLMLLNAGPFHAEICRLSRENLHPLFGSSANRSLQGTKFRVEDMEPEITAIADVIIDYGLRKYHLYKSSSTLLNVETMEVVRFGSCYELIADILARDFNVVLPPPPEGHVHDITGHLFTRIS